MNKSSSGSISFSPHAVNTMNRSVHNSSTSAPYTPLKTPVTTSAVVQGANRFPERPTKEEKHRLVFEELDIHNNRQVDCKGFISVFNALNLNFTKPTVEDLFSRADVTKRGSINLSEFLNWAHHYPQIIDALYFRSRQLVERARRQQQITTGKVTVDELSRKERGAQLDHENASRELDNVRAAVAAAEEEVKRRAEVEKSQGHVLIEAQRSVELARADRNGHERDLVIGRDKEKRVRAPLEASQKHTADLNARIADEEAAIQASKDREQELQQLLLEAQHNTNRLTNCLGDSNEELSRHLVGEKELEDAHNAIIDELHDIQQQLDAANENLDRLNALEQDALLSVRAAGDEVKAAIARRDDEESRMGPYLDREAETRALHTAALRLVEAGNAEVRRLEDEMSHYLEARADTETAEYTLLEGEVRLREQRYNLDDRDDIHYSESSRLITVDCRFPDSRVNTLKASRC